MEDDVYTLRRKKRREQYKEESTTLHNIIGTLFADTTTPVMPPTMHMPQDLYMPRNIISSSNETKMQPRKERVGKGNCRVREPKLSPYWITYVTEDHETENYLQLSNRYDTVQHLAKEFRNTFRMSRAAFVELITLARADSWFPNVEKRDATRREGSPLELLVLGQLVHIGRGQVWDSLDGYTNISGQTHRAFHPVFCTAIITHMKPVYIREPTPNDMERIHDIGTEFDRLGLHGCFGLVDSTKVLLNAVSSNLRNNHVGRNGMTTRTFNVFCTFRREILSVCPGIAGNNPDVTVQKFDPFMVSVADGAFRDVEWSRFDRDGNVTVVKGLWYLCDNGYLKKPWALCPWKRPGTEDEKRFTEVSESARKSVECLFTLKNRFACLQRIRFQSLQALDDLFLVCCTLHNFLLHKDGLAEAWKTDASLSQVDMMEDRVMGGGNDFGEDDYTGDIAAEQAQLGIDRTSCTHTCTFEEFRVKAAEHMAYWASTETLAWSVSPHVVARRRRNGHEDNNDDE